MRQYLVKTTKAIKQLSIMYNTTLNVKKTTTVI